MTDNKNEKETFESVKIRMFKVMNVSDEEFDNFAEANNFKYCIVETIKLCKQLHDTSITDITNIKDYWKIQCKIESDKICKQYNQIKEKDEEIETLNKSIEFYKKEINDFDKKLSKERLKFKKEIAELQAENTKLKDFIYCKENLKKISCGEERVHFSKQYVLRLKKELNDISEVELNELNKFEKKK